MAARVSVLPDTWLATRGLLPQGLEVPWHFSKSNLRVRLFCVRSGGVLTGARIPHDGGELGRTTVVSRLVAYLRKCMSTGYFTWKSPHFQRIECCEI